MSIDIPSRISAPLQGYVAEPGFDFESGTNTVINTNSTNSRHPGKTKQNTLFSTDDPPELIRNPFLPSNLKFGIRLCRSLKIKSNQNRFCKAANDDFYVFILIMFYFYGQPSSVLYCFLSVNGLDLAAEAPLPKLATHTLWLRA